MSSMKVCMLAFPPLALFSLGALWLGAAEPAPQDDKNCGCSSASDPMTQEELAALPRVLLVTPTPASVATVHVESIQVGWSYAGGVKKRPLARVRIFDGLGAPIYGATVSASWSGCFTLGGVSGVTGDLDLNGDGMIGADETGWASITSTKTASCPNHQCYFTISVTGVSSPGNAYDPAQNVETSDLSKCNFLLP